MVIEILQYKITTSTRGQGENIFVNQVAKLENKNVFLWHDESLKDTRKKYAAYEHLIFLQKNDHLKQMPNKNGIVNGHRAFETFFPRN